MTFLSQTRKIDNKFLFSPPPFKPTRTIQPQSTSQHDPEHYGQDSNIPRPFHIQSWSPIHNDHQDDLIPIPLPTDKDPLVPIDCPGQPYKVLFQQLQPQPSDDPMCSVQRSVRGL